MRINVFEGARRVALLFAVVVTGGVLIAASINEPYLSVSYNVAPADASMARTGQPCPTGAGSHYFSSHSKDGGTVGVSLCLTTIAFGDKNEQLVPYRDEQSGIIWGAPYYSTEVSEYASRLEKQFAFSPADNAWVDEELSRLYWKNWGDVGKYLVAGLAIYWALVWAVGWIVRGFAGIPMHRDARAQGES